MKVLFIGLNWLGDIVMSLPTMLAAARNHQVHILTRPNLKEVYKLGESFQHIHTLASKGPVLGELQKLRRLKAENFEQVIVLPDSMRAAIMAWLLRAPSIGYNTQGRKMFLTRAIAKPDNFEQLHEAQLHLSLAIAANLVHDSTQAILPKFELNSSQIEQTLGSFGLKPKQPFIILAPGAAFGAAKRWPPEKFSQLAEIIARNHPTLPIIITGSAGENDIAEQITTANCNCISLAGRTTLRELAVLLSQAKAMVANDSGTMHLAAMFATPTLVPVGPTDMARTGALSSQVRYFYGQEKCPQAPCRLKVCPRPDHLCMQSIAAEKIAAALEEIEGLKR